MEYVFILDTIAEKICDFSLHMKYIVILDRIAEKIFGIK